ncbi:MULTISPECIES: AAA family ATPase [Methylobacterium]|jgi:cell division protease FtsH|uniref:AAA+ ATPase domain-containing protein n=7 Tax=Pseudomonadota TaxID=1224 RepID=A0AA37WTT7_9HYPH|nr:MULTISPECIES: AAA family ATPase [Methylobacterium]AWV14145.1 AAA family ATPase [Methylobacterium sp. XJLW]KNY20670.1 AAA family ATPase [Methylobacterium sp. ARG-1]MDH2308467.1 AAA family ATPase [Methylobacterium brachiatum]PIU05973.1 MAG: AAA family ATPase [Methylobacterium sp. CG09_land_8_20_14_0_10_71_15]PIU16490.1 MAG: AAA family ATPase [Methylobacterium sp. CG08_land_8_20_14_0_20_71_15]
MPHLTFLRDDLNEAETGDVAADERRPATETLAAFALEAALSPAQRRRIAADPAFALVVQVPAADWVEPVREACGRLAAWGYVAARTGASRSEDRADRGNDRVADRLARGDRVLGVSQSPARYLPSALVAAADLHVRLPGATDAVIARVVRAATGRRPTLPPGIARGLDFFEIAAAVRGTTARACVARLAAAARSKATADPAVGSAPDFATLVGFGDAHAWGTRLIDEIATWRASGGAPAFQRLDRHVALSSAPGLGKSSFVRSLAKAAGLPLVATSVGAWFTGSDGHLGGVLRAWDAAYTHACALAPSILFLDEADSIPNRATMDNHAREWWTPLCTSILLGFDALNAPGAPEVCIIAATNHGDRLDPALIRPGRLGRVIEIKPPSAADLAVIFRQHLDDGEVPDMDLAPLGALALGASGAQVAGWVSEARAAARAAGRPMRPEDLLGRVAPPDQGSPADRRRSAYHEAGHAVAFERIGARVAQVDLVPRRDSLGATSVATRLGQSPTRAEIEGLAVALLCGRAAEILFLGEPSAGAGGDSRSDLARVTTLLAGNHASLGLGDRLAYRGAPHEVAVALSLDPTLLGAVERDLDRLSGEALAVMEANRTAVAAVAELLIARRLVSGDALRALIAEADQHRAAQDGGQP